MAADAAATVMLAGRRVRDAALADPRHDDVRSTLHGILINWAGRLHSSRAFSQQLAAKIARSTPSRSLRPEQSQRRKESACEAAHIDSRAFQLCVPTRDVAQLRGTPVDIEMPGLTLTLGKSSCMLLANDLQKYPCSLLADMFAHREPGRDNVTVDIQQLPQNPLAKWPEGLDVIPALYRTGYIPIRTLEQLLADHEHIPSDAYNKIKQTIEYLNLPLPVSSRIPESDLRICDGKIISFSHHCKAIEAVDLVMNCRPYWLSTKGLSGLRIAAFLITSPARSSSLSVHLARLEPEAYVHLLRAFQPEHTTAVNVSVIDAVHVWLYKTKLYEVCSQTKAVDRYAALHTLFDHHLWVSAVGAHDRQLVDAFQAATTASPGLSVLQCDLPAYSTTNTGSYQRGYVPLWLLRW